MADEQKRFELVFELQDRDFRQKARDTALGITGINQALELLRKTYDTITGVAQKAGDAIERGADVGDIEQAFQRLSQQVGVTSQAFLGQFNEATARTISNFDLMRKANEAFRNNLKPDEILNIAKAARSFAEDEGKQFIDVYEEMVRSVTKGDDRFFTSRGIIIDNKKAYDEFAQSLGKTAEQLNEVGKREAVRRAGLQETARIAREAGIIERDAGDKVKGITKAFSDQYDQMVKNITQAPEFQRAMGEIEQVLSLRVFPAIFKVTENGLKVMAEEFRTLIVDAPKAAAALRDLADAKILAAFGPAGAVASMLLKRDKANKGSSQGSVFGDISADISSLHDFVQKADKANKDMAASLLRASESAKAAGKEIKTTGDATKYFSDSASDAAKKTKELEKSFTDFSTVASEGLLSKALDRALDAGDFAGAQSIAGRLAQAFEAGAAAGIDEFIGTKFEGQAREIAAQLVDEEKRAIQEKILDARLDLIKEEEEAQREAYQRSVDFFEDIFTEVVETGTIDLEGRLKRAAIQFAAQMAAAFIGGGGPISGIIGSVLGVGGGDGMGIGGIAGLGTAGAFGSAALESLGILAPTLGPGSAGVAAMSGLGFGASTASSLAAFAGPAALVAGGVYLGSETNWFGLGGGMSRGERERRGIRQTIADRSGGGNFNTPFGDSNIWDVDFHKFEEGVPILEEARKAVEGLALAFAGGTEQTDEFQKIFALMVTGFEDGAAQAENANEVLFATQEIMAQMGLTADEAKAQLLDMFFKGEISAEQFGAGIESLSQLAMDNLIGDGSVADAVRILAKSIEEDPRAALKALELAFKEAAEVAGDQFSTVQDFFVQVFGQDAIAVFNALRDAGIQTWQDIANASVDQIKQIFDALAQLGIQAEAVMGAIASATVNAQGGPADPSALNPDFGSRPAGSFSGGRGSGGQTDAQRRAEARARQNRQNRRARRTNRREFDRLFGDVEGSLGNLGTLDDSLLGLLGGGSQFSVSKIVDLLGSQDFLGLGGGAGVFGQVLRDALSGFGGGSLAPLSAEVSIDQAIDALSRPIPNEHEFGPASELVRRVRTDLQGRAFRGQGKIGIGELQNLFGSSQSGLFEGFSDVFGADAASRAQGNISGFTSSVIQDLRTTAGQDLIDVDHFRSLLTEVEEITKDSFIAPLQDARTEMLDLFGDSTKKGVNRFIEETNRALDRLAGLKESLKDSARQAEGLLGKLAQIGKPGKSATSTNSLARNP